MGMAFLDLRTSSDTNEIIAETDRLIKGVLMADSVSSIALSGRAIVGANLRDICLGVNLCPGIAKWFAGCRLCLPGAETGRDVSRRGKCPGH
jgi:hypothetical protein